MEVGEKKQFVQIAYNANGPYLEAVGKEQIQVAEKRGRIKTVVTVFDNFPKMKPGQKDDIIWDFERMEASELTFTLKKELSKEELAKNVKHAVFLAIFKHTDRLLKKSL